jgi:hypothetical protein
MTPAEEEFADSVIRQHFYEDRNEADQSTLTMLIAERKAAKQTN